MRALIVLLSLIIAAPAMAGLKRLCVTDSKLYGYEAKPLRYEFGFEIQNYNDPRNVKLKTLGYDEELDLDFYFRISPKLIQSPLETLNFQPMISLESAKKSGKSILKVRADAIGMNYATLVLYRNSRFKNGYLVTRMYGETSEYTKVTCKAIGSL